MCMRIIKAALVSRARVLLLIVVGSRLLQRPEHDYQQMNDAEIVRQLKLVEDSETRQLCDQLRQEYCLERPLLAGDALTTLHQTILEQLERLELRTERDYMTSARSCQANESGDLPHNVTSPAVAMTMAKETIKKYENSTQAEMSLSSCDEKEPQSGKLPSKGQGERVATEHSLDSLQLHLDRTKTFITEIGDGHSEPGTNQVHLDDVSDKEETENVRLVKSAFPILEISVTAPSDVDATSSAPTERKEITLNRRNDETVAPIDVNSGGNRKSLVDDVIRDIEDIARQKRLLRTRMNITAFRRGQRVDRMLENPTYRDWETSDRSLSYLEHRVNDFLRQTSGATSLSDVIATDRDRKEKPFQAFDGPLLTNKQPASLPKLTRYEPMADAPKYPIPGGRVLVRKRDCDQQHTDRSLPDHVHININVVPQLDDYDRLRRSKLVMYHLLDDVRQRAVQT